MKVLWLVGIVVGLAVILVTTLAVFGLPVRESLGLLVQGAFGDKFAWSRTAAKSTPLLFTGLGMIVAWRGGMYNIGGEGQFLMGALLSATLFAVAPHVPSVLLTFCLLSASCVGGAAWAGIAGWLSVRRGVDIVIGTILLNFIALQVLAWAVGGPLKQREGGVPMSETLPASVMLPKLDRQMDVNAGSLVAIAVAAAVFGYVFRSKAGYRLRLVGENARMARAQRISVAGVKMQAIVVSGALCGLAGGVEYVGIAGQLGVGFSQGWGFLGIPVALIGGLNPLFTIGSAAFFGALFAGSENLARFTPAGTTLIYIIQAVAVLSFVGVQAIHNRRSKTRAPTLDGDSQ